MESFGLKIFAFISFHLLLVTLARCNLTDSSTQLISNPVSDVVCALRNCGQGTCKASNSSLFGFDCECHPGWKKIQIVPLAFPSCVVPNCTVDFQCSKGSPAPPPPPALPLPPSLNLSNPCTLVWCGEGTCLANGTGYTCQCYEGSENLFNLTGAACFRQCKLVIRTARKFKNMLKLINANSHLLPGNLGADCNGLRFGSPLSLSPPPSSSSSSGTDISYGGESPDRIQKLCWGSFIRLLLLGSSPLLAAAPLLTQHAALLGGY
ncbi:hypothetical protein CJ030_MR3G026493 [Morella rubra]|uniref:EGF-like domain-containing protein n=1 Tax=Morella rubra TaxID=262757 RepID=A0A6A1W162_9ROSI|nr:hypothetical protein CJ030_MR3G026493 [Morella rubra]